MKTAAAFAPFPLGRAFLRLRRPVTAGAWTTVDYVFEAGGPIDDTGYVLVVFRHVSDFGRPQFDDPAAPNYCAVATTGRCRIVPRWDSKGFRRPWSFALYLKITGGYLDRGERIAVTFGDRRGGSPGWRMQTFVDRAFRFKTLVDPVATFQFKELPQSPALRVLAGPPAAAVCIAPSEVVASEPFQTRLRLLDAWGNPTARPRLRRHPGFPASGLETVERRDRRTGLAARSNPIRVVAQPGRFRPFWGDLHGQSEETIGTGSIEDYWAFGRDHACMDILSHQGNDFQIEDAFWDRVNDTARRFYEPGRFVTFPGYEWSGNTPLGGDRNVYFESEGGPIARSSRDLLLQPSRHPDAPTADDLFRAVRKPRPWFYAHVGGRYADLRMHDPREVAVEIHSAWGTFEWLLEDAFRLGYRVGVVANSDEHKGRPGASYPGASQFGAMGGLTCVLAERLDRASVAAAIRARRCYATTGARILLDVALETAGRRAAVMGAVALAAGRAPILRVRVAGTGPIERVEVRNGPDAIATFRPSGPPAQGRRIQVTWSGAETRGRARMTRWDGGLAIAGNRIATFAPVNFWNPSAAPRRSGAGALEWRSVTTGGDAGVILTLRRPGVGRLELRTAQRTVRCSLAGLGTTPRRWDCGGLRKRIEAVRLPDAPAASVFAFDLPLAGLRRGDNPVYVCVRQEDGHRAWSSPIYVVRR